MQGARRLTFERFLDALALLAERKGASLADLAGAVLAARGPCVSGTRADYVKFHDDKARPRTQRVPYLSRLPEGLLPCLHVTTRAALGRQPLRRRGWRACQQQADEHAILCWSPHMVPPLGHSSLALWPQASA